MHKLPSLVIIYRKHVYRNFYGPFQDAAAPFASESTTTTQQQIIKIICWLPRESRPEMEGRVSLSGIDVSPFPQSIQKCSTFCVINSGNGEVHVKEGQLRRRFACFRAIKCQSTYVSYQNS